MEHVPAVLFRNQRLVEFSKVGFIWPVHADHASRRAGHGLALEVENPSFNWHIIRLQAATWNQVTDFAIPRSAGIGDDSHAGPLPGNVARIAPLTFGSPMRGSSSPGNSTRLTVKLNFPSALVSARRVSGVDRRLRHI